MPRRRSQAAIDLDAELERWRGSVNERLDRVISDLEEERNDARKHRQSLRDVISALSQSVTALAENVRRMEPIVADYRDKASEARGAAKLGKIIWAAVLALGAAAGWIIGETVRMLRH